MNPKYLTVNFSVGPIQMLAEIKMVLETAKRKLIYSGYEENEAQRMIDLVNELTKRDNREDKEKITDELERLLNE